MMRQDSQSFFAICSRALLIAFSLLCATILVLQISVLREEFSFPLASSAVAILAVLVFAPAYIAVRGQSSTTKRIVCELAALAGVFVAVEAANIWWVPSPKDPRALREHAAARLNLPFDSRYMSEVVRDLRKKGIDALPRVFLDWPHLPAVRRQLPPDLYPLSHASNAVVVACNESGRYHLYRSDEWGFNNPPGLLASGDIDVALVGESYFLGYCLPASQSLAGRIRKEYPRAANFAAAGNTTLGQLGSFREYVEPTRPRVVLWAVNPHFVAPSAEDRIPALARYLEPTYTQHLLARQRDIDRLVRSLAIPVQVELDRQAQAEARNAQIEGLGQIWLLPKTRERLGRAMIANGLPAGERDLAEFLQVLQLVKQTTERWGGRLVVVVLPIYAEVVANQVTGKLRHDHLAKVLRQLGITVVDGAELFEKYPDPAALYTMRINNHPTAEGYSLLADRVLLDIQAQFPMPAISTR